MDLSDTVSTLRAGGALFAYVHGSQVDGTSRPGSDTDVAAHFGGRSPRSWEVAVPERIDLVVLDDAPLYLAGRIALRGRLLFDDAPPSRVAWEADTRLRYLDELPLIQESAREYLAAEAHSGRR